MVESFKYLGTVISSNVKWDGNISSIVKRLGKDHHSCNSWRNLNHPPFRHYLVQFYTAITEFISTSSIIVWLVRDHSEKIIRVMAAIHPRTVQVQITEAFRGYETFPILAITHLSDYTLENASEHLKPRQHITKIISSHRLNLSIVLYLCTCTVHFGICINTTLNYDCQYLQPLALCLLCNLCN